MQDRIRTETYREAIFFHADAIRDKVSFGINSSPDFTVACGGSSSFQNVP